ncbi:hypothetical protein KNT64_gp056 [Pseudomonas phage PspYZU05]|uniref:Uncharacterized protein n=1 Tax=Pseudomonas phage PspYZU05 TaxID=1983556 RepID=A0A2U7NLS8_9CAUD|nr:hypothetical protein KNT64_gp056 [Pseudomonas phage PspYZU05]ASD52008.1 hypothetical protein PspYZU05_56 [Pseudomonas phage PspYZU05]
MITLVYDPMSGISMADGKMKMWVDSVAERNKEEPDNELIITIGSDLLFQCFRIAVIEDKIHHDQIRLKVKDQFIPFNTYGNISEPRLMPDFQYDLVTEIVKKVLAKKNLKKKEVV